MRRWNNIIWLGCVFLIAGCNQPSQENEIQVGETTAEVFRSRCSGCHKPSGSTVPNAPSLISLAQKNQSTIRFSLTNGTMRTQAAGLSTAQIHRLSEYISQQDVDYKPAAKDFCLEPSISFTDVSVSKWAFDERNTGVAGDTNINSQNVSRLILKWAFELPGVAEARSQPVITRDTVFIAATTSGELFALDRHTGCIKWHSHAMAPLRSALTLGNIHGRPTLFFGNSKAETSAVDARNGKWLWTTSVGMSEYSIQTGAVVFWNGALYVPVSLNEVALAQNPEHECCTAHGLVRKLDAASGKILWTRHMTSDAQPTGKSRHGTRTWGPSGAPVWSTPTIDVERGAIYVGTGQNASAPATELSDSVVALSMNNGAILWHFQATRGDTYNNACSDFPKGANCPKWIGPDFDFGASIILSRNDRGEGILLAGQKSGDVYALNPDKQGEVLWRTAVGSGSALGGVHWGMAATDNLVFAGSNDPDFPIPGYRANPGLAALDLNTGKVRWRFDVERGCQTGLMDYLQRDEIYPACSYYYAFSAALTVSNDLVFAPALDGTVRAFSTPSGHLRWKYDTAKNFDTVSGTNAHGGAMDNSGVMFSGDMAFMQSGYDLFGQLPGNVFLAFELKP